MKKALAVIGVIISLMAIILFGLGTSIVIGSLVIIPTFTTWIVAVVFFIIFLLIAVL